MCETAVPMAIDMLAQITEAAAGIRNTCDQLELVRDCMRRRCKSQIMVSEAHLVTVFNILLSTDAFKQQFK